LTNLIDVAFINDSVKKSELGFDPNTPPVSPPTSQPDSAPAMAKTSADIKGPKSSPAGTLSRSGASALKTMLEVSEGSSSGSPGMGASNSGQSL